MRTHILLITTMGLAAGVAVVGCSSGGKKGSGGGVTLNKQGGAIQLSVGADTHAFAYFYDSLTPEPGPLTIPYGDDECVTVTSSTAALPATTYGDVGQTITFSSGAELLEAVKSTSYQPNFVVVYSSTSGGPSSGGTVWTVTNSGGPDLPAGIVTTILAPTPVTVTSSTAVTSGSPLVVTWTGGENAGQISIDLEAASTFVQCRAKPDGSFTVPASFTSQLGASAIVSVVPLNLGVVTINGRDVLVEAVAH